MITPAQYSATQANLAAKYYAASGAIYSVSAAAVEPEKIEDAGITVGEIIAWRTWKVKYGFLTSAYVQEVWAPDAPMEGDVGNGYGVHAWKSPHKALTYLLTAAQSGAVTVVGKVALWGEVVEHERGYRAQYAKPLSFDYVVSGSNLADEEALLTELRERYKIEKES